jgi:hypothetical protein
MHASNPFATRFTRPGAVEFLFPPGKSAAALADALQESGGRGQILGPHGSGKSTLLATLLPELQRRGRKVRLVSLATGDTRLDLDPAELQPGGQLVIDGFEQLGWLARRRVKALARTRGSGLLVTAHADVGLPTLFEMQPSLDVAGQVVRRLLPEGDDTVSPGDVERAYQSTQGNLRETLFALFDVYQARTRKAKDEG